MTAAMVALWIALPAAIACMAFTVALCRVASRSSAVEPAFAIDHAAGNSPLAELSGFATGRNVIVVTDRGVEIPLRFSDGWTVAEFTRLLSQINNWPDTPEREVFA